MCSASTIYSAIKASGIRAGEWAVFPGGGGGVGSQGVQLASAIGLRPIVVDTGAERRKLALELGAEHFVDFKEVKDPIEEVVALTEGGAHACFVTGESRPNRMSSSEWLIMAKPYKLILPLSAISEVGQGQHLCGMWYFTFILSKIPADKLPALDFPGSVSTR